MKDPARNPELESGFSFTGTISDVRELGKIVQLTIHQDVASRLPTDFKLIIPSASVTMEEFPYIVGDTVMVIDALMYEKDNEYRLRVSEMSQIRATAAQPGELNALSFSGTIIEARKEEGYTLVVMEQDVLGSFKTRLDLVVPDTVKPDVRPKVGDIGLIKHALFYEKDGCFRAKICRPTYKILYTPDAVMDLGTIEAKEVFL